MHRPYPHHGIGRTRAFIGLGWTPNELTRAVRAGLLLRPTRGWLALPSTDPLLLERAGTGHAVSCVTLTTHLGLWQPQTEHQRTVSGRARRAPLQLDAQRSGTPPGMPGLPRIEHLAVVRKTPQARPEGAIVHWRRPLFERQPDALLDRLENALQLVAECCAFEDAVAIWDSALHKRLVSHKLLAKMPLGSRAQAVLEASSPFADSGVESFVRVRLRWLRVRVLAQAYVLERRVDFLIGDSLVLQIDGGHHVGWQRTADNEHDAALHLHGYTVIRVSYEQVMHRWNDVLEVLQQAIAQGLHQAR